jgi:hypothetical protein
MSKLTTAKLKSMISKWISTPEIRKDLDQFGWWEERTPEEQRKLIDTEAAYYGFRTGCTQEELEEHIWKLWCDGNQWKRSEKYNLKDEAVDTFSAIEYINGFNANLAGIHQPIRHVPNFPVDFCGECNQDLVEKYFKDPKLAEKCVKRVFIPDNELAENYRLEVITTHDDTEVVGWQVITD